METSKKSNGQQSPDLTLFAADTPANHLAPLENDAEPMTLDTFGHGLEPPLANYNPDTQSWKTSEDISLWGDYKSLESLPKSGMTRNGVLYRQPEWVRPIDETELLLWPTPTTQENEHPTAIWNDKGRRVAASGTTHSMNLADAVQMWPTPTAVTRPMEGNVRLYRAMIKAGKMTEAEAEAILGKSVWEAQGKLPAAWPTPTADDASNVNPKPNRFRGLVAAVNEAEQNWPTPQASSWGSTGSRQMLQRKVESGEITESDKKAMQAGNGGKLNPTWVEWLMGFPLGWTDLED